MRLAAIVGYVCDQNEPSKPDKELVWLPDDNAACEPILRELYKTSFNDEATDDDLVFEECRGGYYGDLQIGYDDSYLFATFVEVPEKPNAD